MSLTQQQLDAAKAKDDHAEALAIAQAEGRAFTYKHGTTTTPELHEQCVQKPFVGLDPI